MKQVSQRLEQIGLGSVDPADVLWVGIDVSKRRFDACCGTSSRLLHRKLGYPMTVEGAARFHEAVRKAAKRSRTHAVMIGLEPTSVYWKPLYFWLKMRGFTVVLVHSLAVRHNRETVGDSGSKTDVKDAYSVWDLLRQGKFFIPIPRDPEAEGAFRYMQRYQDSRKQICRLRSQLREVLAERFPELNDRFPRLEAKTALAFLQRNPTPDAIRRVGRSRFLHRWRGRRGQWGRRFFEELYELAGRSFGIPDPQGVGAEEMSGLARQLEEEVATQESWYQKALAHLQHRHELRLILTIKGIGEKTAVGLLSSLGSPQAFKNGKQWVKLAGLDLKLCTSGDSVHRTSKISRRGIAMLRYWLCQAATTVTQHNPVFEALRDRRRQSSPGKGSNGRAIIAVADKLVRVIFAMLRQKQAFNPDQDRLTEELYRKEKKAA